MLRLWAFVINVRAHSANQNIPNALVVMSSVVNIVAEAASVSVLELVWWDTVHDSLQLSLHILEQIIVQIAHPAVAFRAVSEADELNRMGCARKIGLFHPVHKTLYGQACTPVR